MESAKATALAAAIAAAWLTVASGQSVMVRTREVEYKQGTTPLQGFFAWNDAVKERRPGVLVVHEWWGLNQHARNQAKRLAEAGYVSFALDMFGKGKVTTHPDQAEAFVAEATKDPATTMARFNAGLEQLKQDPHVDPKRVGAIGYCFGGAVVLSAARSGADLDAVATFHGAMPQPAPVKKGAVKAKGLILAGGSDPMVPQDAIARFVNEMKSAGTDVRVVTYPGAKHSFTNPDADKSGVPGLQYNAQADKESWAEMLKFFRSIWGS